MRGKLLVLILLLAIQGTAAAAVDVFYQPETGFLRVTGEVIIDPSSTTLSFVIFPSAHVTEFWADHLLEYHLEQASHGLMVSFSLQKSGSQTLSFSYEGFLEPETSHASLNRDVLWFPEFSFPSENPQITLQLPLDWEPIIDGEWERLEQGSGDLIQYQTLSQGYPTLQFSHSTAQEEPQPTTPVVEEFFSRIQIQVRRLTTAISQRDLAGIEPLLSPTLRQAGLAEYLSDLPPYHGQFTSEFASRPNYLQEEFSVVFASDSGHRYLATMAWGERADRLELQSFRLTPYEPEVPVEVRQSLEQLVQDLHWAVHIGDKVMIRSFLDTGQMQYNDQLAEFFLNLNTYASWSLEFINLDPFTISILLPATDPDRILLELELAPGAYHWLIRAARVIPLG